MCKTQLVKCPRCRTANFLYTPYFKCYRNCHYVDEKDISYRVNETEEKQRKEARKIIKHLFLSNTPAIEFPETNIYDGNPDWGWIDLDTNTVFFPRKTFYLPNEELVDTVVHESSHLLSEPTHKRPWYDFYLRIRKKVFAKFSEFANSTNPQAKFEKGYRIYPDHYIIKT